MVLGDLLGPAGGEGEELTERTVRDRYLVGVLAPSRSSGAAAKPAVDEEEDEEIPLIPDELSEGPAIPPTMATPTPIFRSFKLTRLPRSA
jgi:hypothetical protein